MGIKNRMKINLHDKMPFQDNEQKILVWENNSSVEFPLARSHTRCYILIAIEFSTFL